MAEYILKDSLGKEQTFADDKIFVQGTDGELVQFTMGTGGSASADLHYVTFMSYDGLTEYGKKAVADGDDCADPIVRGIFDTPTRESDAQYNYTFGGWATEANGAADADWNKAVTEDKTVYAAFTGAVRYYTITFYDEDGTTVLNTKSVAYGSVPSYTPTRDGYNFKGWVPEIATVTEDASYIASWSETVDFASCSWAKIAEYAESGEAASVFEIGAKKSFTIGSASVTAKIIGFNHDDLSDGSGKAGITLEFSRPARNAGLAVNTNGTISWGASSGTTKNYNMSWDDCEIRYYWTNNLYNNLPDDLKAVIKQVKKKYYDIPDGAIGTTDDHLWMISMSELGFTSISGMKDEGECYEGYTDGKTSGVKYDELIRYIGTTAISYQTRSKWASGVDNLNCITTDGAASTMTQGSTSPTKGFAFPCFCI